MSGDDRRRRPQQPELDEALFDGFTKTIDFLPAYDLSHPNPNRNYGCHCVDLRMVLSKGDLAVQFVLYTGWYLPQNQHSGDKPLPADLGYHSGTPLYDDQSLGPQCEYIGQPCYYDGSGLAAGEVYNVMLTQGGNGVWLYLRDYWQRRWRDREAYAESQREIADLGHS